MQLISYLSTIVLLAAYAGVKLCLAQNKIHLVVLDNGIEPYPIQNYSIRRRDVNRHHRAAVDLVYGIGEGKPIPASLPAWDRDTRDEIKMRGLIFLTTSNHIIAPLDWRQPAVNVNDRWAILPTPPLIEQTIVPEMKGITFTYNLVVTLNSGLGLYEIEERWQDHELFRPTQQEWIPVDFQTESYNKSRICTALNWGEDYRFNKEPNDAEKARYFPTSKPNMVLTYGTYQLRIDCLGLPNLTSCLTYSRFGEKLCSPYVDDGTLVLCPMNDHDKKQIKTPQFMIAPRASAFSQHWGSSNLTGGCIDKLQSTPLTNLLDPLISSEGAQKLFAKWKRKWLHL